MAFNCKSNANWPPGKDTDFATVESNQILTTEFAHDTFEDFSVLIDQNGNVLTKGTS
jgi:hypothetical protein